MTYKELTQSAKMIHTRDKYGEGPYRDAFAGVVEIWIRPSGGVYRHETCNNGMAYTGRTANTEYCGKATNPQTLIDRLSNFECDRSGWNSDEQISIDDIVDNATV